MAKGTRGQARTMLKAAQFDPHVRKESSPDGTEMDIHPTFGLVHNCDYPLKCSSNDETAAETDEPEKAPIAFVTVHRTIDGRDRSETYRPIPGLEYLFDESLCRTRGSGLGLQREPAPQEAPTTTKLNSTTLASTAPFSPQNQGSRDEAGAFYGHVNSCRDRKAPALSKPTPRLKRTRSGTTHALNRPNTRHHDEHDKDHDADPPIRVAGPKRIELYIGNIEHLKEFYTARFRELTMKPLRLIVTEWVKTLAPHRQRLYGPYHEESTAAEGAEPPCPWWPRKVPYREPSHLKVQHLVPLAVDLMLLHRRIDEECGKRGPRCGSWIAKLKRAALYCVTTTAVDQFTSSKSPDFSQAMKDRALKSILPSLFDIAQAHEDHLEQFQLYEGLNNRDPETGPTFYWSRIPRVNRTQPNKRRRTRNSPLHRVEAVDDSGSETEVDEEMHIPITASSSFHSTHSSCDNENTLSESNRARDPTSPQRELPHQNQTGRPLSTGFSAQISAHQTKSANSSFDQSLRQLHIEDTADVDKKEGSRFEVAPSSIMRSPFGAADCSSMDMSGFLPSTGETQFSSVVANSFFPTHMMTVYQGGFPSSYPHPQPYGGYAQDPNPSTFDNHVPFPVHQSSFTQVSSRALQHHEDGMFHGLPLSLDD